jgi:hypothetical protein
MKPNSCACYGSNDIHECYCNLNKNNMEQTAVEWLYEELWKQTDFSLPNNILEQAKEMERRQIISSITKNSPIETGLITNVQKAQEYYNNNYKKD